MIHPIQKMWSYAMHASESDSVKDKKGQRNFAIQQSNMCTYFQMDVIRRLNLPHNFQNKIH